MAAPTADQSRQIDELRRLGGAAVGDLSPDQLLAIIETSPTMNSAAATLWTMHASATAGLIDVAEGSSRRALGDLHEQAIKMAVHFRTLDTLPTAAASGDTSTYPIRRA